MNPMLSDVIIIGSSRGLGAALVQEFLRSTSCRVYGISRTSSENIPNAGPWGATGRYQHVQADIADDDGLERMRSIKPQGTGRLCVIFNAAHIEKDYCRGEHLDQDAFDRVNRVGISGLRNTIAAFEGGLIERGGSFVGVSSFWGRLTPVTLPYIAYPATKAYLDSSLRSLRFLWPSQIRVASITIGNIKEGSGSLPAWFIPTYGMAAQHIVKRLIAARMPDRIEYPCWHAAVYKYVLSWMPEKLLPLIFGAYLRLESRSNIPAHNAAQGEK